MKKVTEKRQALADMESDEVKNLSKEFELHNRKLNTKNYQPDAVAETIADTELIKHGSKKVDNLRGDACAMSDVDLIDAPAPQARLHAEVVLSGRDRVHAAVHATL